ncbi:hypothetical protein F5Y15DRAFT_387586 [Xylariaceae sp. FL0016]|nr:hypothetical protein F5Y15DRAFT_387586 [Xylariaceae sp. FL0016]
MARAESRWKMFWQAVVWTRSCLPVPDVRTRRHIKLAQMLRPRTRTSTIFLPCHILYLLCPYRKPTASSLPHHMADRHITGMTQLFLSSTPFLPVSMVFLKIEIIMSMSHHSSCSLNRLVLVDTETHAILPIPYLLGIFPSGFLFLWYCCYALENA